MAIDHIKNSTGSILNRYKVTKEDGSTESVQLAFNPSDDYEAGTPFNEDSINPIIDVINNNSPKLTVHASTGTTVIATCGDYSLSKEAEDDVAVFQLSTKGTWLITNGDKSQTIEVIDCGNYEINFLATIMGIKFDLSSSDPAGIRTDDAVGLNFSASVGNTAGSSDFWDMPIYKDWFEHKRMTLDTGDMMSRIPKFWCRRYRDDQYEYWQIADMEVDGFELHPAFNRDDGERDYIYIGCFETSSNNKSVSGATPTVSQTRATFRSNAKNKGSKWSQVDVASWSAFQMLVTIECGTRDVQTAYGQGYTNSSHSGCIATGTCDGVPNLCGRPAGNSDNVGVVVYGIENPWGNLWKFIDGGNWKDGIYYICTNQDNFADDTASNYKAMAYTGVTGWSSSYITQMGIDSDNMGIILPTQAGSGSSSTYYCDCAWSNTGWRIVIVGAAWDYGLKAGFCFSFNDASSNAYTSIGSRLLYAPLQ